MGKDLHFTDYKLIQFIQRAICQQKIKVNSKKTVSKILVLRDTS